MIEKTMRLWVTRDRSLRSIREIHESLPVDESGRWFSLFRDGTPRFVDRLGRGPLAQVFPLLYAGERVEVEVTVKIADGSDREFFTPEGE